MCGIGVALHASEIRVIEALRAFNASLAHRGPDDRGIYQLQTDFGLTLGLAHSRLSILDLSAAGHQPMVDPTTGNVIVFNGEIYNHRELAKELESRGEVFTSHSDTEVLLKAYKHFKPVELLCRLRGMFAFALWDARQQRMLIARDPCGIKPIYYSVSKDGFACASEARALVQAGYSDGGVDVQALDSLLAYGSVQAPLSIYRGVRSLLPGHLMWINGNGSVSKPENYWDWHSCRLDGGVEAIAHHLSESMRRHLVSDVPVGIFLSGGFDSTAIATLAAQESAQPIKTFTLSFPEVPEISEGVRAAEIASRLGLEHQKIELTEAGMNKALPGYFRAMDQPSDDGLNVYLLSKAVAEYGVKTCMHGVGGDELFGGYASFRQLPVASNFAALPRTVRNLISGIIDGDSVARNKLAAVLRTDLSLLSTFLVRRSVFSYEQRKQLLGSEPPLGREGMPEEWIKNVERQLAGAKDLFSSISILELTQYSGNKLLPDGDVMSMANGLELRFPLLDVDLIGSVLNTEERFKRSRLGKLALTNSVSNMPIDLIESKKRGFTIPMNEWMSNASNINFGEGLEILGLNKIGAQKLVSKLPRKSKNSGWLREWQLTVLDRWANSWLMR